MPTCRCCPCSYSGLGRRLDFALELHTQQPYTGTTGRFSLLRNGERGARHRQRALARLVAADEAVGVHKDAAWDAGQRAQLLVANAWGGNGP